MSNRQARRGLLFILSAPSGTGKTTVAERLVGLVPNLRLSVSYTSRAARPGETDGQHYNFVSRERFEAMVAADAFLEWADVFGHLYGTALADTERVLARGDDLLLVIDVQGARKVRSASLPSVSMFLMPPSFDVLDARLRGRDQDSAEAIRRRLTVAREEVRAYREYDYVMVNDDVERCVGRVACVVQAERQRLAGMAATAEAIVDSFPRPDA